MSGVALSHGPHPNMVHRWLHEQHLECEQGKPQRPAFVPLSIPAVVADDHIAQPMATALTQASGDGQFIRIEVQRASATTTITWSVTAAARCAVVEVPSVS
ncbi:MAG: hypothetical protein Q7J58_18905 [Hydrogenophaga sp.]|uniref:hypothetical protein n=1 Tax=Hydrogenophaga sp. TaxID=1904254 RepID=UPI00271D4332|nr:hypothetical protein [Hydrogenophaga sp.]MDO9571425.1 hypothetical protein [Hydrogenophaga sp.]